jgi:SAM-dependent methyltransferase
MNFLQKIKFKIFNTLQKRIARVDRSTLSYQYISGNGLEIGALNSPLEVKKSVKVQYLDRITAEENRKIFPELQKIFLVNVDIIGDGESLIQIEDSSQDFIIANHFIEHCQNVIKTLQNFQRVLKPGGFIFMAVPDKRFTFDINRDITNYEHILKDFYEGPEWYEQNHYVDFVKHTEHGEGKNDKEIEEKIVELKEKNFSIHFHVWDFNAMLSLLMNLTKDNILKFDIELAKAPTPGTVESIFILKKK